MRFGFAGGQAGLRKAGMIRYPDCRMAFPSGQVEVDPGEGIVTVDLRDNIDCVAVGVNLSQTCATAGALIGVLNCIDRRVPRNEGSFSRHPAFC